MQDPKKVATVLLSIIILSMGFVDYWGYSKAYHSDPTIFLDILQGTAEAPNQYRVAVVAAGSFLANHGHLGMRHTLTFIDTLSAFVAVFTLFFLLRRSSIYQRASNPVRWFAVASFIVLVQFYLAWVTWYQRPETMPTAAFVALVLLLLTVRPPLPGAAGYAATAAGMLLLAVVQGFVRADVAFALYAGIFLVCLTRSGQRLSLPRGVLAVTSMIAAGAAAGIQLYLMRVVYPHATYSGPVFELGLNFKEWQRLNAFTLFIPPYAWTIYTLLRRRFQVEAAALALACGSMVFMVLWWFLGRVEEVRIFLPFALALAPLSVQFAMQRFVPDEANFRAEVVGDASGTSRVQSNHPA